MEKAASGEYRLLYLSPERLSAGNTFEWLSRVPVGFFAVDERIAFRSGGTSSDRNTANSAGCAPVFRSFRLRRSRRARRSRCGTTF